MGYDLIHMIYILHCIIVYCIVLDEYNMIRIIFPRVVPIQQHQRVHLTIRTIWFVLLISTKVEKLLQHFSGGRSLTLDIRNKS